MSTVSRQTKFVGKGLVCTRDPKIYASSSLVTGRVSLIGKDKEEEPDKEIAMPPALWVDCGQSKNNESKPQKCLKSDILSHGLDKTF